MSPDKGSLGAPDDDDYDYCLTAPPMVTVTRERCDDDSLQQEHVIAYLIGLHRLRDNQMEEQIDGGRTIGRLFTNAGRRKSSDIKTEIELVLAI